MFLKIRGYLVSNFYKQKHNYLLRNSRKIIIGSSYTYINDWFSSDFPEVDITSIKKCSKFWKQNSKDAFLAEHVWEHLDTPDAALGAKCCYYFLKNNGRLRVAVPDGYHPNQDYINQVKPFGSGLGSEDHKVLYNIESLSKIFMDAGFIVKPLEHWDSEGKFHRTKWSNEWGIIRRSADNDSRNTNNNPLTYTSVIIDCFKRPKH